MVRKQVGFLRLNREHRGNILTPNYIKNIRRSLDSLNMDEVVKVIYMTGGKGQQFSTGTDFRTILHHKKDGSTEPIAEYLEALYGLQVHTSKINKPILGVAPGSSYNSGATFLQATGFPTVTLDSKMAFNEVTFGFVPHSGASYYLSRLPNEMGTFLALTGLPITGVDAMEVGLAENMVHHSEAYEEDVTEAIMAMEFPVPDGDLLADRGSLNPWVDQIKERIEGNARM
jgi:enoyl-CoA hydratase/carnithine racemase